MMKRAVFFVVCLLGLVRLTVIPAAGDILDPRYSNTIAECTAYITNAMAEQEVVGCSIALLDDQTVVWVQGFGMADAEAGIPVTTSTVFHIGSVSKAFTAAAVLQHVAGHRLHLDEPVTNILASLSWKTRYPTARSITIRDLLSHHSGLPGDLWRGGFTTQPLDSGYATTTNDLAETYPIYEPDTIESYCNVGFVLLEAIVEAAAQTQGDSRPFTELVDSSIFTPLGMTASSYLKDKAEIIDHLAIPYQEGQRLPEEYVNIHGTGSMYSRPTDLALFMRALLAGGAPILSNDVFQTMVTDQSTNALYDAYLSSKAGLGWDSVKHPQLDYVGRLCLKTGATMAYSAMIEMLLDHKLGVAITASSVSDIPVKGAEMVLQRALYEKAGIHWPTNPVVFPTATQTVSQAALDALAGVYAGASDYDLVEAGVGTLTYRKNVITIPVTISNLVLRTNDWFMADDVPTTTLCFTNLYGRDVVLKKTSSGGAVLSSIQAVRYHPPALTAAWSNRLEKIWMVRNVPVNDYLPYKSVKPWLMLYQTNNVLLVLTGGYGAISTLEPQNDQLAFVVGLNNRGDSSLQIVNDGEKEYILYAGNLFGPAPENVQVSASLTGVIARTGFSEWYSINPAPPGVGVGGISNVIYEISMSGAPTNFLMRLYDGNDVLMEEHRGNGHFSVASGEGLMNLRIQPDVDGVQTGAYRVSFNVPVMIRKMHPTENGTELIWQGASNISYRIESAEFLTTDEPFVPSISHIAATGLLNACTQPVSPDGALFYRAQDAAVSNRLGRVVILSDFHMSPFASAAITEALRTSDLSAWDGILAAATNGYFTKDATGYSVTTPMLYNSALTNAWAACPQPDGILIGGDFPYYNFGDAYQQVTGDSDPAHWKELLVKMIGYMLLKINQTWPGVPVYTCMGNNDTYLADYDITVGDAFYADTAASLYDLGLSNLMTYASFASTFTNAGNYTAPFGVGDIIALQSLYMSSSYPRGWTEGSNQIAYLQERLADCKAQEKPAWLLFHIPPNVNQYATWAHWRTGDTYSVSTDWQKDYLRPFCEVMAQYSNTVAGIFCGHSHLRNWTLVSDPATSNVITSVQVANGLLYNHGNNPAFTIFTYDRTTLMTKREYSYSLDYNAWKGLTGPAIWSARFSESQGYGLSNLSPASLLSAWSNMSASSDNYGYYSAEYTGGRTPYAPSVTNWPVYHGALRWILPEQFRQNVPLP
jgi:CubicO group peptidase (beta-lactamase class C family)